MISKKSLLSMLLLAGTACNVVGQTASSAECVRNISTTAPSPAAEVTNHSFENISEFLKAIKDKTIATKSTVTLHLDHAKVLASGIYNIFVRDNSGAACCLRFAKLPSSDETKYKNIVNYIADGYITGELNNYNNNAQFFCIYPQSTNDISQLTFTPSTEAAQPIEITASEMESHLYDLVKLKGLAVSNDNRTSVKPANQDLEKITFGGLKCMSGSYLDKSDLTQKTLPYNNAVVDVVSIVCNKKYACPRVPDDFTYVIGEKRTNIVKKCTAVNVRLERTLNSAYWNTFCMPVALTKAQVQEVFGANTKIAEYDKVDGSTLMFKSASTIQAGKPYLIKPEHTVADPVFHSVNISNTEISPAGSTSCQLVGVYNPTTLATDQTALFITTQGTVSYPAEGHNTINGLRAYIKRETNGAKDITLSLDGIATDIALTDMGDGQQKDGKVYTVSGQYVGDTVANLPRGLYIINKQKVFIK